MISKENKLIIDILRNRKIIVENVDFLCLYKEMVKQKLFLVIYPKILTIDEITNNKTFQDKYSQLIINKNLLFDFFNEIVLYFNTLNIDYVVLKGFVNELLIYENITSRYFTDIDILVDINDFDKIIDEIKKSNFNIKSISNLYDFYLHEVKIVITYKCKDYTLEIKKRHRELSYKYNHHLINNKITYKVENLSIPHLNYSDMFVSSCIYIHNYFERIESILYLQKIRLSYFYDLYQFYKKYGDKINVEYIKKNYEIIVLNKIVLVLEYLYEIFLDDSIYDYINNFRTDKFFETSIIKWNFTILERIFNEKKIRDIIIEFYEDLFYVNKYTERINLVNYNTKYTCFKIFNVEYEIKKENNNLCFKLYNISNISLNHYIIYFLFYYKNIYGEFLHPFNSISFRSFFGKKSVFNNRTIIKKDHLFFSELEKNAYSDYTIKDDCLMLKLNTEKLNIRCMKNDRISFHIELVQINENNDVTIVDRNNEEFSIPSIIKIN